MSELSGDNYIRWKNWDAGNFAHASSGAIFYFTQFFKRHPVLRKQSEVLEIGFGNGELLGYLKDRGHKVVGVEINPHLVERAAQAGFEAYAGLVWDISELQSRTFDSIFAFDVVEHMTQTELNAFFSWAKSHLKSEGRLILRFPEGASPFGLAYQNGDFTHVTSLTASKTNSLCEMNGLKLLSYSDEFLRSNQLCSYGFIGKLALIMLQAYAKVLRTMMRVLFYPLSLDIKFSTNSIAVISPTNN